MSKASPILENFNTGELSPLIAGRVGFEKYPNGASLLENFIPTTQGPNVRRAGTRFVNEVKDSTKRVLLVPFEFSVDQAYMLEFGDFYVRFFTWDAVTKVRGILESSPGVPVELVTPYSEADLYNADGTPRLRYAQSGDFLYLTHSLYQQRILRRLTVTSFEIALFDFRAGPWKSLNIDGATIVASGQTGSITLTANDDIFLDGHVGSLIYFENNDISSIPAWEVSKAITLGQRRRSDGKTYEAATAGTTGTLRPVHTEGERFDGDPGVRWAYRDPGYGYAKITGVTNSRSATALVIDRLPVDNIVTSLSLTISNVSYSFGVSPVLRITTTAPHGGTTGNEVLISEVIDSSAGFPNGVANGIYTITVINATQFDVTLTSPQAFYGYVSGGKANIYSSITQVGTQRWAFGEWSDVEGWPSDVTFYRERLWFGRRQMAWGSVSADFSDFSPRSFGQVTADMAITVTLSSGKINDIQWMIPDRDLVIGTAGGEFAVGELTNGEPLGPTNRRSRVMSQFGSRAIPPIKNVEALLFIQRSGLKARETFYDFASDGYKSSDTTVLSEHITRTGVTQMAFAPDPDQVVWATRADGLLLGFTWNNEQAVRGWHRHPIGGDGVVETIAVMPAAEGDRSELWMVVRRTIDGVTKRYVEYLERSYRTGDAQTSQFYVDSGLTYTGAATSTISGLDHLEGATVSVLVNGAPHPNVVVESGAIELQLPATSAQIGLPCPARYRSMRLEAGARDGTSQGKTKRISKVVIRLDNTGGGKYGPLQDGGLMDTLQLRRASDAMDQPAPLFTGDKVVSWPSGYDLDAYLGFEIDQPVAATIVALMPQVTTQDAR